MIFILFICLPFPRPRPRDRSEQLIWIFRVLSIESTITTWRRAVNCPLGKVRKGTRKGARVRVENCSYTSRPPNSIQNFVSSAAECAFSLFMREVRWSLTVRSWRPRSYAICLFSFPRTTCCSTSRSRGVSASKRARNASSRARPVLSRWIAVDRAFHCVEQILLRCTLGQEIFRTPPHRLHGGRNIPVPAKKDDRQLVLLLRECFLQIQPAQARHL